MTWFVEVCGQFSGVGVDLALRTLLVLALAALVTSLMRRSSATARHLVWSAALVGTLVMPAIYAVAPIPFEVPSLISSWANVEHPVRDNLINSPASPILYASASPDVPANDMDQPLLSLAPVTMTSVANASQSLTKLDQPRAWIIHWPALLVATWLIGAALFALPLLLSVLSLRRLRRTAQPLAPSLAEELRQLAQTCLGRRLVTGLQSELRRMPMTWGIWRPIILLPAEAVDWSPERRRLVLLHELAHIKRHDCLLQIAGQLTRALHWFNPLAWRALHQLRLEQEKACDDAVLNAGIHADEYATELLSITARIPAALWDSAVALAIGRATRLEQRLAAILDLHRNRRALSTRRAIISITAFCVLIVGLSTLQYREAQAEPSKIAQAEATTERSTIPASDIVPVPKTPQVTPGPRIPAPEGIATQAPAPQQPAAQVNAASVRKALDQIEKSSVSPVDPNALNEGAIRGMVQALKDPYSSLVTTEELKTLYEQIDGRIVGIGAALSRDNNRTIVRQVIPNSPALKGGLQQQDEILTIDGQAISPNLAEAVKAIRGMSGTEVTLKIRRAGQDLSLTLTRGEIRLPAVRGLSTNLKGQARHWLDQSQGLAYVQIAEFTKQTPDDLKSILQTLTQEGLKGLVLDVRGCPGGLLTACVDVARLFLNNAKVVETRGRTPDQNHIFSTGPQVTYPDLPLVVLIDKQTASAAEVLTVALKDNGRAIVVGERSFGKGSVQSILPLEQDGPALRLTTAELISPSGRSFHRQPDSKDWGIDPTDGYFIPLTPEQRAARGSKYAERESSALKLSDVLTPELIEQELSDPALAAAHKTLQSKLTTGEFAKVGRPLTELQTQLAQQDELRKQRDEIRRKLELLDRELGEANRAESRP